MSFNKILVDRLKREFGVTKDLDIAERFNVTPFVFSSWKRSKGKLLEEVVRYGIKNNLDFNKVLLGKGGKESSTTILMSEDLFEYCMNPKEKVAQLSKKNAPMTKINDIGFQVISQNMEPTITVSSIVFGKETTLDKLKFGAVYVIHVDKKGIFISRFYERIKDVFIFVNDNESFEKFSFSKENIVGVFVMDKILSNL
ncbi:S24/S26 family peptidase [Myroides guanonis]|uniref:Peptidase S24/S26A/S26B/S26C domain-containing protein n=1 Tax=Myroides guanonis TaxID=1150112 RepID=A0A1I3L6K0_9FLAO|nr:S24/S26 family peptidase [Myroides guanonis]SFI80288.1 hypothetical protein SAMN04487893_101196 [Myroides guanonis]